MIKNESKKADKLTVLSCVFRCLFTCKLHENTGQLQRNVK